MFKYLGTLYKVPYILISSVYNLITIYTKGFLLKIFNRWKK